MKLSKINKKSGTNHKNFIIEKSIKILIINWYLEWNKH